MKKKIKVKMAMKKKRKKMEDTGKVECYHVVKDTFSTANDTTNDMPLVRKQGSKSRGRMEKLK